MAILTFTLSPEAIGKLYDSLVCLGKFSEAVSIEASHDKLVLTALNSSKSAYCSFTLIGNKFFSKYLYRPVRSSNQSKEKFTCKIYNKALLSVFKGRVVDPTREKDTAVERCDVSVEDGEGKSKSRFVIKMVCRHGVLKTFRLTFESVAPMHALFVRESANNCWSISSRTLKEFVEHFGPGTEQLDIYSEDARVSFTSYTEKIMSGNEILKQPLHTTIAVDTLEFGEFAVEEKLHIVISVKDFKSMVAHAGILNVLVKALYSRPSSPMQLSYSDEGIMSEFILMTIGESRGGSATPANASRTGSKRPASKQPLEATSSPKRTATSMPPPPMNAAPSLNRETTRSRISRPSPPPPQPSVQSQSLFLEGDDDRRWDPANFDGEEEEEMLLWDTGGEKVRSINFWRAHDNLSKDAVTMNSARRHQGSAQQDQDSNDRRRPPAQESGDYNLIPTQRLAPTQRLSEVRGMFDD
ncbi:Rad9-domain-containing protein [Mollisia scopiformis]|uniref:DNA repair protein rad9 n=1 Tax=Mollisia scopiformis TaxID=149040 RepID=A0A194WUW3_MOLSC|nr:Rad9-domain-containing protein [Mollisia scopiformis]KUJ11758.1 Rad9-domain-containing protein [Mollisia scopiformis]